MDVEIQAECATVSISSADNVKVVMSPGSSGDLHGMRPVWVSTAKYRLRPRARAPGALQLT